MLLVIDIGNTNIVFGAFDGEQLKATLRLSTATHRTAEEYGVFLMSLFPRYGLSFGDIDEVCVSSVVPPVDTIFEELVRTFFGITPLWVRPGIKTGVKVCTDNPRETGADRIANAAAGHHIYGGPLIVVDFGTATTFDAVNASGDYLGGAIAPGIGISAEALYFRAAKLPRIELVAPPKAIGTNTITAMQSGIILGYVGLVEGLVTRMRAELDPKARVIATGGLAAVIAREAPIIDEVDEFLTLKGLRLIYEANRAPSEARPVPVKKGS